VGKRIVATPRETADSRHLRWESFEPRIYAGPPSIEAISGNPRVHLFIEPAGRRIGIRFFTRIGSVVPSPLTEVTIREVGVGSETALEVTTENQDLYRDFYSLCCSIADRAQIEKQPVSSAVAKTLASWAALIRRKSLLSQERQIGLLGELLFLRRAAKSLSWNVAAHAWLGPDSEEHDFVLPSIDAEVKATSREQRIHMIGSLMQLQPKLKRKLQLVSVQLTQGGENKDAFSLSTMVASVLAAAGQADSLAAESIRDQIRRQGWEDEDAPHYRTRYCLRAPLMTIDVSRDFPAITLKSLRSLGREAVSRIDHLTYSINVDSLGVLDGTKEFERTLFGN
jgi:hypothetical protein